MVETKTTIPSSDTDIDILARIQHELSSYPPFMADRHRVHFSVSDGVVHVSGHVKSPITETFVVNRIRNVPGVSDVIDDDFYNDEEIRLDVGSVIPPGVMVTVEYGAVILSGKLPEGTTVEQLVHKAGQLPGVHHVVTSY